MSYRNLLFIGAPGCGKGTQASLLSKSFNYSHISTGDLLRKEISNDTDLGRKVSFVMSSGGLVSDDLVIQLLLANCNLGSGYYIFDGFPRTLNQAELLLQNLFFNGSNLRAVYFDIDFSVLKQRAINRRFCSKCGAVYNLISKPPVHSCVCDICGNVGDLVRRKDDYEDVIDNRLQVFKSNIDPMLVFLEQRGILVRVDAMGSEKDVFDKLKEIATT